MYKIYNKNNVVITDGKDLKLYSYNEMVCKYDSDLNIVILNKDRTKSITTEKYINQFLNDYNLIDYKIVSL